MEQTTSKVFAEASASAIAVATGTGSALFVINLCASMAPMAATAKTLPGLEKYRVYQVSRAEDGRTRYRLRLGFFTSEADAEQVLAAVRDQYPTAFTACLADEDRKFARGYVPEYSPAETSPSAPAARPQMTVVVDNDSTRPARVLRVEIPTAAPKPAGAVAGASVAPPVTTKPSPTPTVVGKTPAAVTTPNAATVQAPSKAVQSTVVEIDWEPAMAPAQAPADAASADNTPIVKIASAALADAVEIEMTWESTAAVAVPASTTPQALSPIGKNAATIERSTSVVHAASARGAATTLATDKIAAPSAMAAAKSNPARAAAAQPTAPATPARPSPSASALITAPLSASVPAPVESIVAPALELMTTTAPLPTSASPTHRGVIHAKAPSLDSIRLTLDTELGPDAPSSKPAAATNQPFHVGKGVELPPTSLTLDSSTAAKQPATPRDQSQKSSTATTDKSSQPALSHRSALSYDNLDSTQTIRALTAEELNDESQEKCFAIQLAVSEQPVNLDAMPHLDIFEAYRLYSIATAGSGKITHSLRIGFFREEVSAEAVSGYLRTFFPAPTIVRISLAEQARFKDALPPVAAPAAAADINASKVVALSEARARNTRTTIPTVTMAVATPATVDAGATGSFKPHATGSFKPNATGSFKASATGTHKAVTSAAKSSTAPTRRSAPLAANKKSATGKHPALPKKPLSQQLIDEAREVDLAESAIRKLPKSASLLARLVGKLSK